ncbi:neutral alpha-glucosidase ab precursor [Phyllosticta citrichinensis]|uniref:alpha-glucosidase n=1 Tax=Phyllosticta citrichinensis TaxID=1130410 RepID=A0ABR1XNK3_9PEZI
MPQTEFVPENFQLQGDGESGYGVQLSSRSSIGKHDFSFEALRPNLFRTTFTTEEHPLPPHPSAALPSVSLGSEKPSVASAEKSREITYSNVRATVQWNETPTVKLEHVDSGFTLHEDLAGRSYAIDGTGVAHYSRLKRDTLHVGLGEKAAPMDLTNRSFILTATDSFGYDVYKTDPMYKHIPLLINATPEGCIGLFSTSHSRGFYSLGGEMDGQWGHFKVYRQDHGGLEEYIMVGDTISDIVRLYADLVGYPIRVPRWAMGYLSGGYKYTMMDEPRAHDALVEFAEKLKKHDIPCSAMQMSSGYSISQSEPQVRNVFTWNEHRFPDPKAFIDDYHRYGIKLLMNIKPYLLQYHPEYENLKKAGAFFTDPMTNEPAKARLWSNGGGESDVGGHIDFTSEAGFKFWYNGVKYLKGLGCDAMWNDNNEYTIPHDGWKCALDGISSKQKSKAANRNDIGLWGRALHTELHAKSSHDALLEVEPDQRPFVLTRSASPGTMRYAGSSWSGDNVTSWDGMKGSNALSLNAGMSLLQCYGHDIGGFEGPQPTPELLLRWIQLGIYSSRFAINCFKTSPDNSRVGEVIEPWMYPEIIPNVRATIKRRYELIPFLYSLHLDSHLNATPPQRWTGWGYESDPEVWTRALRGGETQYWLGDALLIGGVFEPGQSKARMYLPKKQGDDEAEFLNLNHPHQYLPAGQWVDIESPWEDSIPVLARVGSAVPVGKDIQVLSPGEKENPAALPQDDYRAVEIFPPRQSSGGKWFETTWYEDDGISLAAAISSFTVSYASSEKQIKFKFSADASGFKPSWTSLGVVLPVGDKRTVVVDGKQLNESKDSRGRVHWTIPVAFK